MALNNHVEKFTLDMAPGGIAPVLNVSQGDIGRKFTADIFWGGSSYDVSGLTAKVRGRKRDNTVFEYVASLSGTTATFETKKQMTIIPGNVDCEIVFFDSSSHEVGTANFTMIVEEAPYDPDAPSQSVIPGIEDLIEQTIGGDVRDETDAWLDAHPEATTTLQDGAVTKAKINTAFLPEIENAYVTPEMFGAAGDGATDDTTAVQAAIDSGLPVWMLNTYKLTQGITLHSDLSIYGFGKGKITKDENTTTHFASLLYYGDNIENVKIDGVVFVGLQYWTNQTLSGYRNDFAVRIENADNITITNCIASEFGGMAFDITGNNVNVSNNKITYSGEFPVSSGIANYNFAIGLQGENIVCNNNIIDGVITGINTGDYLKNAVFNHNIILSTKAQHGFYIASGEDLVINDNIVTNCALAGVKLQSGATNEYFYNVVIDGNTIRNCGAQGVLLAVIKSYNGVDMENVTVSNNTIVNVGSVGVDAQYCNDLLVTGNNIETVTQTAHGVRVSYGISQHITNNKIVSNRYGILTEGSNAWDYEIEIEGNNIEIGATATGSSGFQAVYIDKGKFLVIKNNLLRCTRSEPGGIDGIYIYNPNSTITEAYVIGNISKGFRWDIRANGTTAPITCSGNFVNTITGITQT